MSYWVETGIKELEDWEQRVFTILSESLSPERISYYFDEYKRDVRGLYERSEKGEGLFTRSIYGAISSISQIRSLLEEIKQHLPEKVPLEQAARFALLTFRAGIITGMTSPGRGMEVLGPFAKTRFAQMQNQPKTRYRKNNSKDDIFTELDGYLHEKGRPPANLPLFIAYLERRGFEIDGIKRTVDSSQWENNRKFGTIDNWRREFSLNCRPE